MTGQTEPDPTETSSRRLWEIDALRGVAIIMMVLVHVRYDLVYFGGHGGPLLLAYGFWSNFAKHFVRATIAVGLSRHIVSGSSGSYTSIRFAIRRRWPSQKSMPS